MNLSLVDLVRSCVKHAASVAVMLGAVFACGTAQADLWVAPSGADSNNGSQAAPFR